MSIYGRHYSDSCAGSNLNRREDESIGSTVDLLQRQIALEFKLQGTCQDLLYQYKESRNWVAVSQVAQNLITNSQRISQLEEALSYARAGCVSPPVLDSISELQDTELQDTESEREVSAEPEEIEGGDFVFKPGEEGEATPEKRVQPVHEPELSSELERVETPLKTLSNTIAVETMEQPCPALPEVGKLCDEPAEGTSPTSVTETSTTGESSGKAKSLPETKHGLDSGHKSPGEDATLQDPLPAGENSHHFEDLGTGCVDSIVDGKPHVFDSTLPEALSADGVEEPLSLGDSDHQSSPVNILPQDFAIKTSEIPQDSEIKFETTSHLEPTSPKDFFQEEVPCLHNGHSEITCPKMSEHCDSTQPEIHSQESTVENCKELESSSEKESSTSAEVADVITDDQPHPLNESMPEATTTTLSHAESDPGASKVRTNGVNGPTVTVRVSRILDSESGRVSYRVDMCNPDPSVLEPELSMTHSFEEFCDLREQLAAKGTLPGLDISNCESHKTNIEHSEEEDACKRLEEFLSAIISDPLLQGEPVVVRFLTEPKAAALSQAESQMAEGERKQEATSVQSEPTLLNGDGPESLGEHPGNRPPLADSPVSPLGSGCSELNPTSHSDPLRQQEENGGDKGQRLGAATEAETPGNGEVESELVDSTSSDIVFSVEKSTSSDGSSNKKLSRSESNPILSEVTKLDEGGAIHLSLLPSAHYPSKAASNENIVEDGGAFIKKDGLQRRQRSVPSIFSKTIIGIGRSRSVIRRIGSAQKKPKRKMTVLDTGVEIPKSIPTQEWDPTCLLEELYSDHKPSIMQSSLSGESARYFGYMEKLPVNQSKPTMIKGWKRRYFRAMEGNIFYYEDRTSEKALGFTRLSNSRIICNEKKQQIHVVEKNNGKSLVMKAPDGAELNAWHRALQLEAAHPTMSSLSSHSPGPQSDNPVLIIDIGACSVRAGFAGDNAYPQLFFPAVCSIDASTHDPVDCGLDALLPQNRYGAHLIHPRKQSLRMDRHDSSVRTVAVQAIIESVLIPLNVQPQNCQLLLVLPPTVPEQERNKLAELLLETFAFSGIYLQEQAILALYSYNTTSGIVVDIGDHVDIIPVIDGYSIEAGITRLPFGGNAITENFSKLITLKGLRYFSETEMYINRFVKESLCFVSQDYADDCTKCNAAPSVYARAVDVDRFQLPDHRKVVALDSALFRAPEGLFDPSLWGKDVPGIHKFVWKAVQACPIDQRKELSRKIFLSGASSLIPGLQERLQREVSSLAPQGSNIEVHASETRHHAAFLGASVLASLGSFQSMLVTQEEWSALGLDALKKLSVL